MIEDFWRGKKVLVTGHTGFKGSWLSLWLIKLGCNVEGIALDTENPNDLYNALGLKNEMNSYICDIRNRDKIKYLVETIKPDIVFHLAAQPLVRESYKYPAETWETNVLGTINVLESLKDVDRDCTFVGITTDKVYKNKEWIYGYREIDELGGKDPYSSSKAACEIAISSWRDSFAKGNQVDGIGLKILSARAGNVIGGGDWAVDRIVPDSIRSLAAKKDIIVRNPASTRPWQHVLEPISGYMTFAAKAHLKDKISNEYNFGPTIDSNRTVDELVNQILRNWSGTRRIQNNIDNLHEAKLLQLTIERAENELNWKPKWDFEKTVNKTVLWYKKFIDKPEAAMEYCIEDLNSYTNPDN